MTDIRTIVARECVRLADVLSTLSEAQWDAQSLCEKWRTREVIAHLTMPTRFSPERFGAELAEAGGDFTVMSDRAAARDGSLPTKDLVAAMRSEVMQGFAPPGGGYEGALNHVVIHGLDVTAALGIPRASSDSAVVHVLDQLARRGGAANFGHDLANVRLVADDLDWSFGSGSEIACPASDLVLYISNRRVDLGAAAN